MTTASCSKWPSISPQEKNVEDSGLWSVIRYHLNYNINYLSQATDPQSKIRTKHGLTKHLLVGSINLESLLQKLHSIYTFKVYLVYLSLVLCTAVCKICLYISIYSHPKEKLQACIFNPKSSMY